MSVGAIVKLPGDLRCARVDCYPMRVCDIATVVVWRAFKLPGLRLVLIGALVTLLFSSQSNAHGIVLAAQTSVFDSVLDTIGWAGTQVTDGARALYSRAPALALGMLCIAILLPFAVLTFGVRSVVAARRFADESDDESPSDRTALVTGFSRPRRACLEGADLGDAGAVEIRRSLTRIGRADDNEVVIDHADLEPYHAAIERTPECDIYLCDLTRGGRRAARVNGRRAPRLRLCDGDVITLGKVSLTYRTSAL